MNRPFRLKISNAARYDILNILQYTSEQFGVQARRKYSQLIQQAIKDVQEDPERPGAKRRPELTDIARTYHLFYSRDKIRNKERIVKKPRHFLLFRISGENELEVGRVLHDSMELNLHLPEQYRME